MKGCRLEIKTNPATGKPDLNLCMPTEPGDYVGPIVGYTGPGQPAVFYLLPNARDEGVPPGERSVHHATSPPHVFTEEDDGSLTITASILSPHGWHGWLTRGEWSGG